MATNPYERLTQEIQHASNLPEDTDWVQTAFATLATNSVKAATSESAVRGVIRQVEATGQSPAELYGPPQEWAAHKVALWRDKGTQAFEQTDIEFTARTFATNSFMLASWCAFLLLLVLALPGEGTFEGSRGLFLLPLFLGTGKTLIMTIYSGTKIYFSFPLALIMTALATLSVAIAIAFSLETSSGGPQYSAWWLLAEGFAFGVLAWGSSKFFLREAPGSHPVDTTGKTSQDWFFSFKHELRHRGDMNETRVQEEIYRVHEYIRDAGESPWEEFGDPVTYARSLAGQRKVPPYRNFLGTLLTLTACCFWAYSAFAVNDPQALTWKLPLLLLLVILLVLEARKNWHTFRQAQKPLA